MGARDAKQNLARLVAEGRELHLAGKLAEAEPVLRQALAIEPNDPESLHRLGMILDARGQYDAAIDLMQRSILRAPNVPEFFNNLGEAFRKAGRVGEALRAYERSLQLRPGSPEALNNMALVMLDIGDSRALEYAQSAARAAPGVAQIRVTVGRALHAVHDDRAAVAAYREARRMQPDNREARQGLVTALAALGEPIDEWFNNIPNGLTAADVHNVAAEGYLAVGRLDDALRHVNQALAYDPKHLEALAHLGSVLIERGEPEAALDALQRGIAVRDVRGLHQTMAFALLGLGRLGEGFREYENRPKAPPPTDRGRSVPQWTGAGEQTLSGKTVLLLGEQGYGDTFQFIRYAPLLAARGAKVWVQVNDPVAGLMRSVAGIDRVWTTQQQVKGFDLYCPLGSLPHAFGTELNTVPADVPYLHADPARVEAWRERLTNVSSDAAVKVGLVWQGNPRHPRDRLRSISLAMLATPLAAIPGVKLFSLQKNEGREQLSGVPAVEDLDTHLTSFDETAAAIAALDLVISVDTSVAHLAGALGKPVWTLIAIPSDWRWMIGRADTPWYPTMRLYRQSQPGDWTPVVSRVAADLRQFSSGGT